MSGPDHAEFLERLRNSHSSVLHVVALLQREGLVAEAPPQEFAATPYESGGYTNQHDVIVRRDQGPYIIEVKERNLRFTTPEDFPFPTCNVCTVKRWDGRTERPHAFLMVSKVTGVPLAVSAKTFPHWEIEISRDGTRGGHATPTYRVAKIHLRSFDDMVRRIR